MRVKDQIQDESPATEAETREHLLTRQRRQMAPVLNAFVQNPDRTADDRRGPLSTFVSNRDLRGLQAFLFAVAVTSNDTGSDGWSTTLSIPVWARALDFTRGASAASAATAVSKVFGRLEDRNLIERERHGRERKIRVTLFREDGSGQSYTRPGRGNNDKFLQLPYAYWLDGWFQKLDLPATAMLLVSLHAKPSFTLASERMPSWYGWSADTAERGFATLVKHGLIDKTSRLKKAPLSPTGLTRENVYTLIGPFARAKASASTAAPDPARVPSEPTPRRQRTPRSATRPQLPKVKTKAGAR